MAVKTRKFASTTVDANGNLHANGVGLPSSSSVSADTIPHDVLDHLAEKTVLNTFDSLANARDEYQNQQNNIVKSMTPTVGTVQVGVAPGSTSPTTTKQKTTIRTSGSSGYEYEPFDMGSDFKIKKFSYDPFESRYEGQIQSVLDNILNRKSFDLNEDPNYRQLYDQYKENYMLQGNRAMRDQLGAASNLTGGYGSTSAQAAASQAYDQYMNQLNDRNIQLMNLAYGMYQDETADRYNQLGALNNLDNTDYSRWADTRNFDYGVFNDQRNLEYNKWANDRDFRYNAWNNDRNFDYGTYTNDRTYDNTIEQQDYAKYQDAVNLALKYAQQGLPIPSYIAQQITDYTGAADINDVISAMPVSAGGSGGGGGRRGGSGGGYDTSNTVINVNTADDIIKNGADRDTSIEALDEAYMNYYSGVLHSSSAQGKAQALQQIINKYMQVTGIKDSSVALSHFEKLVKKNGGKVNKNLAVTGIDRSYKNLKKSK